MQKIIDRLNSAEVIIVDQLQFGKLVGKVEAQGEKLDCLNKAVFGNGREGLVQTTTRIEERLDAVEKRLDSVDTKLGGMDTKLDTITSLLQKHIEDPNLHSLKGMVNWKVIRIATIAFIFAFILLHAILPPELTVWDLLSNLMGL